MRKYLKMIIALAFLVYGLIRVFAGTALLGQEVGLFDFQGLDEAIDDIAQFLAKSSSKQIIPVSVAGYVSYIALMGLVLATGAVRTLKDLPFGLAFISVFILMYAFLFINFQTINPKIIHLAICIALFIALLSIRRYGRTGNRDADTSCHPHQVVHDTQDFHD